MQAAAQRSGADRDAVAPVQVLPEQRHRPARRLVAAAARVACQGRRQEAWGEPRGRGRSAAAWPVRQGGGIMGRQVAFDPPANTEPRGAHAPGRLADRLSFGDQQHRPDPAIQPCLADHRQRTLEAAPIGRRKPLHRRPCMSAHASQCGSQIRLVENFWLPT